MELLDSLLALATLHCIAVAKRSDSLSIEQGWAVVRRLTFRSAQAPRLSLVGLGSEHTLHVARNHAAVHDHWHAEAPTPCSGGPGDSIGKAASHGVKQFGRQAARQRALRERGLQVGHRHKVNFWSAFLSKHCIFFEEGTFDCAERCVIAAPSKRQLS